MTDSDGTFEAACKTHAAKRRWMGCLGWGAVLLSVLTTVSFVLTLSHFGFDFDSTTVTMFFWSAPLFAVAVLLVRAAHASAPDLQARRELVFWRALVVFVVVSAAVTWASVVHSLARH